MILDFSSVHKFPRLVKIINVAVLMGHNFANLIIRRVCMFGYFKNLTEFTSALTELASAEALNAG